MEIQPFRTRRGRELPLSRLGLGGAPLGDLFDRLPADGVRDTLAAALRQGITLFDTAPHYGNGLSEARMGAALREVARDTVVVSTKVGRVMDPFAAPDPPPAGVASPGFAGGFPHRARFDYSYDGALRSVEQSLLRTGLGRFDIVMIHDCDAWTHGPEVIERRFGEAMDGAYRALDRLRADGTVAAVGLGVNEGAMCERFARAGDFDVMMLAGRYSLLEQPALDGFLPLAAARGIGVLLAGVFNSGILATGAGPDARYNYAPAPAPVQDRVRRIAACCERFGVTLRQAALAFPLGHPAVRALVLGAVSGREVDANARDAAAEVPPALWADLKAQGLLDPRAPIPEPR